MKKHIKGVAILLLLSLLITGANGAATAEASAKLPNKLYKLVKGKWYTQSSSGGWNIKFTRTRVKYYDRKTNRVVYNCRIKQVKKIEKGSYKGCYRIIFKFNHRAGTFCFQNANKKASSFYYHWKEKGVWKYSGSSSLFKGKWKW